MNRAKIFTSGGSQAVRLPKEYRMDADEVFINKIGDTVVLIPKDKIEDAFLASLGQATEDFFPDGRDDKPPVDKKLFD